MEKRFNSPLSLVLNVRFWHKADTHLNRILFLYIHIIAMTLISLKRKELILADAKERVLKNHTLEQIAKSHGITKRTLNTWLMLPGDEYQELRQHCIDNMLAEALEEIDNATEHFPLRAGQLKVEGCALGQFRYP